MRAESHRVTRPIAASSTATPPITSASTTTTRVSDRTTMASTTRPARTGVATASAAPATLRMTKPISSRRCGRANSRIRRAVAALKTRRSSGALIRRYIWFHAIDSMLMCMTLGLEVDLNASLGCCS